MAQTTPATGVETDRQLYLASWGERIAAWLIDMLIISFASLALWAVLRSIIFLDYWNPVGVVDRWRYLQPPLQPLLLNFLRFFRYGPAISLFGIPLFLYWGVTEGLWGHSIGKKLLGIKVVDLDGNRIGLLKGLVESFGKSFILLIDLLVSVFLYDGQDKRQRLFNYLSRTVVIRLRAPSPSTTSIEYLKERGS